MLKKAIALAADFGVGAAATVALKAEARPPAYVTFEIELTNPEASPRNTSRGPDRALADSGQKRLASGGRTL